MIVVRSKRSRKNKWRTDTITIEGKYLWEVQVWPAENFNYPTEEDRKRHLKLDIHAYHVLATTNLQAVKMVRECFGVTIADGYISSRKLKVTSLNR